MAQQNTNMKKIILSVSMLIAINTFGQANLDYIYNSPPEKVLLQRVDHIEAINTLEDMIEWIKWDIKTDEVNYIVGQAYVENLQDLLFILKKSTLRVIEVISCISIIESHRLLWSIAQFGHHVHSYGAPSKLLIMP